MEHPIPQQVIDILCQHDCWFEGKDDDLTAQGMNKLSDSRTKVLALADFIVPRHGGMFGANK